MDTTTIDTCLFCKIVQGVVPCHKIYEDDTHLAFLDIYPPTSNGKVTNEGMTLVIPKQHYPAYAFAMPDDAYASLLLASKKVAQGLDRALSNLQSCMVMEGMEVPHVHIKLYPIYEGIYHGYLSTQKGQENRATRADDAALAALAAKIRAQLLTLHR